MSSLSEQERYETVDLPFYHERIAPILPETVLDFHTHIWQRDQWLDIPWDTGAAGGKYMVTTTEYGIEDLQADGARLFPDRTFTAVCFGHPTPATDNAKTNAYAASAGTRPGMFPLIVAGKGTQPAAELREAICEHGFFGYKVYLNWNGDDYGSVKVEDMLGSDQMALADELRLIVLLHVPRSERLADPEVQNGVRSLAVEYPNANIVLAHCGRCYHPDRMKIAVDAIAGLDNVFLDTSMVMNPLGLQIIFQNIDSSRVLFATDLPVANMRGRRVYVMDHWVDVVLDGYPPSAYRVASDGIRATFMAWEIIAAIHRAADVAGLSESKCRDIFFENGRALLRRVMDGRQLEFSRERQEQWPCDGG